VKTFDRADADHATAEQSSNPSRHRRHGYLSAGGSTGRRRLLWCPSAQS
jgi:hypothetical protein